MQEGAAKMDEEEVNDVVEVTNMEVTDMEEEPVNAEESDEEEVADEAACLPALQRPRAAGPPAPRHLRGRGHRRR